MIDWVNARGARGAVIGGIAASIHGGARLTKDVDLLLTLPESDWKRFVEAGKEFGFRPRTKDALSFAKKSKVLLMVHQPTGIAADIIFGELPFEHDAVGRASQVSFEEFFIPVVSVEDLMVMKAIANRPRDLADIEAVLNQNPRANIKKARALIKQFSAVLEAPGILSDFDEVFRKRGKKKGRQVNRTRKKAAPKGRGS
ncbi:MAG: nucleotidyl transferase AbiEii/AbiGii toxin family protein [Burkholderiales bacterium]